MRDLMKIPGVGKQMKKELIAIGYTNVESLKNVRPEELYEKTNKYQQKQVDRCVLYVYRCAVYFASHDIHEKEKLNWWYWKDHEDVLQ